MGPWLVTWSGAEPGLAFQLLQMRLQRERRDRRRETEMERAEGDGVRREGRWEGGRDFDRGCPVPPDCRQRTSACPSKPRLGSLGGRFLVSHSLTC